MDSVEWTWGLTLQERQPMAQVPQTWDNLIQQQQTADGQSEMDMGPHITRETGNGPSVTNMGQHHTVTVDS